MRWLLPLLLVGCGGSVTLDELDGFGMVRSSVWLDDDGAHSIILSNEMGFCGKQQAFNEAGEEFNDVVEEIELDSGDDEDLCEEVRVATDDLMRQTQRLFGSNQHALSIGLFTSDGYGAEPEDGSYDADLGSDEAFYLGVDYIDGSVDLDGVREDTADLDCEDEDWPLEMLDIVLDMQDELSDLDVDSWSSADDGELDIDNVDNDRRVSGSFEATLYDEDGDESGEVSGNFSASYCEL